jgi:hypothetical protein
MGYLPAPYVYGLVYDATGGRDSRWGMFSLECAGVLGVTIMVCLLLKNKRDEAKMSATNDLTQPLNELKAEDLSKFNQTNGSASNTVSTT